MRKRISLDTNNLENISDTLLALDYGFVLIGQSFIKRRGQLTFIAVKEFGGWLLKVVVGGVIRFASTLANVRQLEVI